MSWVGEIWGWSCNGFGRMGRKAVGGGMAAVFLVRESGCLETSKREKWCVWLER